MSVPSSSKPSSSKPSPSKPSPSEPSSIEPRSIEQFLPRGLLIVLGLGSVVLAVAGAQAISGLLAPAFLAVVLMITVHPISGWVQRFGAPAWAGALSTILAVYFILITMVIALVVSAARLAQIVPTYADQLNDLVGNVGSQLKSFGVSQKQIDSVVSSVDPSQVVGAATYVLNGMLGVLSNLMFIAILVLFIAFDSARFRGSLVTASGERPAVVQALYSFALGTRKYFAVSAVFGLIVAVIDTGALYLMGIEAAVVWGILAFITNFIPNIGFVIGVIPPAVLGLLQGGWQLMLAVIVVYSVINFVIQSVIQPKFVGDALGLSTTLTFMSLIFWAWVMGPLGAILALPATLLVKALLIDVDPHLRWVEPLLSGGAQGPASRAAAAREAAE